MLSADDVSANVDAGRAYRYFYDVENALERLHLLFEGHGRPQPDTGQLRRVL